MPLVQRDPMATGPASMQHDEPGLEDGQAQPGVVREMEGQQASEDDSEEMLAVLEKLASTTSELLAAGDPVRAVEMLRRAILAHEDTDTPGKPSFKPMVVATVRLLLCTALSRSGCHDLALREARIATEVTDHVWRGVLLEQDEKEDEPEFEEKAPQEDAAETDATVEASQEDDQQGASPTENFRKVFSNPPPWLVRAVELSIQARQSTAVELEFTSWGEAEGDEVALLHEQSIQLARQVLAEGHPARACAEQAWENWHRREAAREREERRRASRFSSFKLPQTPDLAKMLTGRTGVPARTHGEDALDETIAKRVWLPLPPVGGFPPKAPPEPELHIYERMYRGLPPPARRKPRRLKTLASSEPDLRLECSTDEVPQMMARSAPMALSSPMISDYSWDNSSPTGRKIRQHFATSPNATVRRSPIGHGSVGPGGKATWALRISSGDPRPRKTAAGVMKLNAFDDWKKHSSGPTKSLGAQVLESEGWMHHFHDGLKEKSAKFKNFWLREEVGPDDLYEDRTFYNAEGLRVSKKSKDKYSPPVSPKATDKTKELSNLLTHYGVQCRSEPNLKHLNGLLKKSHDSLMPKEKPKPVKRHENNWDMLKSST